MSMLKEWLGGHCVVCGEECEGEELVHFCSRECFETHLLKNPPPTEADIAAMSDAGLDAVVGF